MIARMKKFHLFFTGDPSVIFKKLQKEGLVEINALPERFGFKNIAVLEPGAEETFRKAEFLKNLVKKVEGKEVSGKVVITETQEKEVLRNFPLEETYEKFSILLSEYKRRENVEKKLMALKEELLPLRQLEVIPSDLFSMKNFSFCLFALDKKRGKIPDKIEGFSTYKIGGINKKILYLIIFPIKKQGKVLSAIESYRGQRINLRRWNRQPGDIIKKIDIICKKNNKAKDKTAEELKKILALKYKILIFYDYANSILHYQKVKQNLRTSSFVNGFSGWVKENDVERLSRFIDKILPGSYLYISTPDADKEDVPIALENNHFFNPFEVVTDLYGRPVYKSLDPTVHLSIFFAISFAFCLTDAAYGLILSILSLVLMKKFRFVPTMRKFLRLLLYGGVATIIMGTITGGWFGDMLTRLPTNSVPVKILSKPVILNPLGGGNSTFIFLGWALIIGYVQILWGLTLNFFHSLKQYGLKKSGEALVLLLIQILVAVLILFYTAVAKNKIPADFVKFPASLLVISFVYLMITKAKEQKGLMMKTFWAFYGGYNVIAGNLLGDVLSYSRLFGLGLTTAVLGLVVNELVFMSTGIPYIGYFLGAFIFIIGHMGNLTINLMGGYVHTSRLQYLEFFTKFFESGGRPFNPFREVRNYTYIEPAKFSN